jgi:precorrin-6Y C5,15-methyltransferase (decarboxylating)
LPAPDAIFVGGTGRAVTDLCKLALPRLKTGGRLVANVNSLDNLTVVHSLFRQQAGSTSVRMLNIARSTDQLDTVRFHALNPTFLIGFVKA